MKLVFNYLEFNSLQNANDENHLLNSILLIDKISLKNNHIVPFARHSMEGF